MSPRDPEPPTDPIARALARVALAAGIAIRDERLPREWTMSMLAAKSGLSVAVIHKVEAGGAASLDTYVRLTLALGLRPELVLADPRRKNSGIGRQADLVHGAMRELEASRLGSFGFAMGIDEPYQFYHFAGRADLVAWDPAQRALLHIENRTRFDELQGTAGAWNAKRRYLPTSSRNDRKSRKAGRASRTPWSPYGRPRCCTFCGCGPRHSGHSVPIRWIPLLPGGRALRPLRARAQR